MPSRGTRIRGFRIPDELYEAAQVKARARGDDLSSVIRRALERYVKLADRAPRKRP